MLIEVAQRLIAQSSKCRACSALNMAACFSAISEIWRGSAIGGFLICASAYILILHASAYGLCRRLTLCDCTYPSPMRFNAMGKTGKLWIFRGWAGEPWSQLDP